MWGKYAPTHRSRDTRMRSGWERIVNGRPILMQMSEVITQEQIATGSSNLVDRLWCDDVIDPPRVTTDQGQKVKGHKLT